MSSIKRTAFLLVFFGIYLITFGILSLVYVPESDTGILYGIIMGLAAFGIAWLMAYRKAIGLGGGLLLSTGLTGIFAWRASVSFWELLDAISASSSLDAVGASFLLISALFVMALVTTAIQVMLLRANLQDVR